MIKDLLSEYEVDFVGLQETMKKSYSDKFFRKIDPMKKFIWHWLTSDGKSGGILCGININKFDVGNVVEGQFSLVMTAVDKKTQKSLTLAIVYGPAHNDKKDQFLTEISNICGSSKSPLLIGGDFNILRYSSEKNKKFAGNKISDLFNWVINTHELREVDLIGGKYTWSNNQQDPILEKLDRILISEDWEAEFPLTNLRKIPRELSDHNPLVLCTDQEKVKKSKAFCFETSWLKLPDFLPKITEIWEDHVVGASVVDRWIIKIKRVKKFLKGWGLSLKGHTRKYRRILREELSKLEKIEEDGMLPALLLERKTFIQSEILRLLEEEELYWHKRSNLTWLLKGDNNTGFFSQSSKWKKEIKYHI